MRVWASSHFASARDQVRAVTHFLKTDYISSEKRINVCGTVMSGQQLQVSDGSVRKLNRLKNNVYVLENTNLTNLKFASEFFSLVWWWEGGGSVIFIFFLNLIDRFCVVLFYSR